MLYFKNLLLDFSSKLVLYKKFFILLLILCFALCLCACDKSKTIILFNNFPITKDNILNNSTDFTAGKKIYYIFITEKPLETDSIRIRIFKRDEKASLEAVNVVYSNNFRLYKDQIYYYNNYIVMNEPGDYCMTIYACNKLDRPLAIADFRVK